MSSIDPADVAKLVRLPAVISVPGNVLVGAAAAGWPGGKRRAAGAALASCCLYLAGMALNDYADREVDAEERPSRPIPSGRIPARFAFRFGAALTGAGLGIAALAGGKKTLKVAVPLAATAWAYDFVLKDSEAGPAAMATARTLNVLMGAGSDRITEALPAAMVVGGHTAVITRASRSEVSGATERTGAEALGGTLGIAAAAAAFSLTRAPRRSPIRVLAALGLLGAYAMVQGTAAKTARDEPTPRNVQGFVGSGVMGFMPLDAAMLSATAPAPVAASVAGAWPLARRLSRKNSPT
jgi:hypothetical protein